MTSANENNPTTNSPRPGRYADDAIRGRATSIDPDNRFESTGLRMDGEFLDHQAAEGESVRQVQTQVLADKSKSLINRVDSPDVPFNWSMNPYRGCEHGCIYCYARPTHEFLGFSCGLDFETKIMAKHDAPSLLRSELAAAKWQPDTIALSGNTDCYQPVERQFELTRQCLQVLLECRNPVGIITKNRLVLRDLDLLTQLASMNLVHVVISVTTLDNGLASNMEPRASAPAERLDTIRRLNEAGVPVSVLVAPVIPGLTDSEIPAILEAVADAGARSAGYVLLRLPHQVKTLFLTWLDENYPTKRESVESKIRQTRDGDLYDSTFGDRKRGTGVFAENIRSMFRVFGQRHGLLQPKLELDKDRFIRPSKDGQMWLFS